MDPNSQHQQWSEWTFRISAPQHPPFNVAVDNLRRMATQLFGAHGRIQCKQTRLYFEVKMQLETSRDSVMDPMWRDRMQNIITSFLMQGWKRGVKVEWKAPRLLAGKREDGKPPDQWIILPNITSDLKVFGEQVKAEAQHLGLPNIPSTAKAF